VKRLLVGAIGFTILLPTGTAFANHERDRCYNSSAECRGDEDYDNGRDDNRRAGISPGPFDRSPVDIHDNNLTICFPFSQCKDKEPNPPEGQQPTGIACLVPFPYHCDPKPAGL
jgi:hypothetical protein